MKQYITFYANPRNGLLLFLGSIAVILIMAQSDSTAALFLTKVAGMAMAYATYRLGKMWYKAGKLPEIDEIIGE